MRNPAILLACTLSLGLAACGGSAPESGVTPEAPAAEVPAVEAPPATAADNTAQETTDTGTATQSVATDSVVTRSDVDAYVRGMQREAEMLQAALDKMNAAREAKDQNAETMAMMDATNGDVDRAGATAAGLDIARYGTVKNAIDGVITTKAMAASGDANVKAMFDAQLQENLKRFDDGAREALETQSQALEQAHGDVLTLRFKMTQ